MENIIDYLTKEQYKLKHKKSAFVTMFKDKIIDFTKKFEEPKYMESELMLFPFFEDYYYAIIKDLEFNNINRVIDIGCQFGLQSELFIATKISYTGIDKSVTNFFNDGCKGVDFKNDNFMNADIEDKVCISSMSLGYFLDDYTDDDYINKLSKCKRLYIVSTPKFIEKLTEKMNFIKRLHNASSDIEEKRYLTVSDGYVYVFERKEEI